MTRESAAGTQGVGGGPIDLDSGAGREWLEANGLGGFAMGTAAGLATRRYHGLLVAALAPPVERVVLLARLDETVVVGGARFELATVEYPGAIAPRGVDLERSFSSDPFPAWEFAAGGVRLRKRVFCPHGENSTVVLYESLAGSPGATLELRPFLAGRDFHSLGRRRDGAWTDPTFTDGELAARAPEIGATLHLAAPGARFAPAPDWYYRTLYREEIARGFDGEEDLFTPGTLSVDLPPGGRFAVVASTGPVGRRDPWRLFVDETARRAAAVERASPRDELERRLALAADAFLARRGTDQLTVMAGVPWFSDWGRDTMIALPGLCLATGRFAEARRILACFAGAIDGGMIPNRFPDHGEAPEYNTVDASLWFFVAVWRYLEATGDAEFALDAMLPALLEILAGHTLGTRHGIREDEDGLLLSGEAGVQLTWMDARVGDRVVTPRAGKPVEIQALWANALAIAAALARRAGDGSRAGDLKRRFERARARLRELFWDPSLGYLYDVVDGRTADRALRPNQLIALALPFPLVERENALAVLRAVEAKLVTPRGLRTLSPDDPAYRARYAGGPAERDEAYHQGTVWPWLLGPYADALLRYRGAAGRKRVRRLLADFAPHLDEAGLGSVSEIFDAEPPFAPRGCPMQAWSVAELLRVARRLEAVGA